MRDTTATCDDSFTQFGMIFSPLFDSVSSLGLPPAPTEYVDSLYEILKCTGLTTVRLRFTLYLLTSLVYYKFIINYTKVVKIQTQVRRSDYYQTQLRHR